MPYFGSFLTFLSFLTFEKFSRAILSLVGPSFQLQSAVLVFSALQVSVYFFFFSYFFCKKLVAILLEMHASAYFIFWNFHKYIFFAIIYDMLSTGKCTHIYIYIYIYILAMIYAMLSQEKAKSHFQSLHFQAIFILVPTFYFYRFQSLS